MFILVTILNTPFFEMRQFISFFLMLQLPLALSAQDYPKGYFRNPLDIPIVLAGNFGECRANHFHSGLDIKTEGRENLPVRAAADGYVSRIRMQNGGFGHALYLAHPNGYTTLYAHLNDFAPAIQEYMRVEQYKRKSWTVDLYVPASKFPVKKGDLIAYSGNTGGSTAPHLHFEIRNSKEHPVNPALFGFDIKDNTAPVPYHVVFYDMRQSVYEQQPLFKTPKKKGNNYIIDTVVVSTPLAGIGIDEFDYMDESKNTLTMYKGALYMDDQLQSSITIDNISYDITRYLHAFADHKTKKEKDRWVQQFFLLPGNYLTHLYTELNNAKGRLDISDGKPHRIKMELADAAGNHTAIDFYLRYNGDTSAVPVCLDELFKVNRPNSFTHPNIKFSLDSKDLYDDVCFSFEEKADMTAYSARYKLHNPTVPVHTYFTLYIKPNKPVPFDLRSKIAMVYNDGKKDDGKAATYDNGWYRASVRNFGEYWLVADTTPPKLIPLQTREALLKANRITFRASEDITSVDKFEGTIDGKWVPFEQSGDIFFYTFDEYCPKGDHMLEITAADENGNTETIKYTFKR